MTRILISTVLLLAVAAAGAQAQSSSMYRKATQRQRAAQDASGPVAPPPAALDEYTPRNPELEAASLIAVQTPSPNRFEVNDIVSVIVREQKDYQSKAKVKTQHDWELESEVDEFFKFINGHIGAATFSDGHPNIDFEWNTEFDTKGDSQRQDSLTFRIAVRVIDIKPNGQLVLSGKKQIQFDEDAQTMTITGICRAIDITPDNTVLSSQVYDQVIAVKHDGPLRDSGRRGWLVKLVDWLTPF